MRSRLSAKEWSVLRETVMVRDSYFAFRRQRAIKTWYEWSMKENGCLAPALDSSESGKCSGRLTLDHVRDQPMMGKKAPDDERHLVTLCESHHLWTQAGRNWATANRPLLREYLEEMYESDPVSVLYRSVPRP